VGTVRSFGEVFFAACCAVSVCAGAVTTARAQAPAADELKAKIDDLKGKIFDARMAQQTFAVALKHCPELDGKSFYFRLRDRILNLDEYFHSLENLVKAEVYNPAKRRPWSLEDAKERWEEVKKQAKEDKEKCELVRTLPQLEKQLAELQKNAAAATGSNPPADNKAAPADKSAAPGADTPADKSTPPDKNAAADQNAAGGKKE
jgi:ribosomal protein L29